MTVDAIKNNCTRLLSANCKSSFFIIHQTHFDHFTRCFFLIYFHVNINFHLIEGTCLCVFVLYLLHRDILFSAHLGMFPASLLGPIVVHVASLCACFFKQQYKTIKLSLN